VKKLSLSYQQLFLLTTVFGLAVAAFLWNTTISTVVRGCLTGGCSSVLFSPHAKIFGVSIAVWGTFYYALGVILSVFRVIEDSSAHRLSIWLYSVGSVLASLYFFYLELFKIHAICSWCKLSTLASILLLTITLIEIKKRGGYSIIKKEWDVLFSSLK